MGGPRRSPPPATRRLRNELRPLFFFYHTSGTGHIYQGRFKAFAVESDEHLYTVCRYVERNPLRANLVAQAEAWRWSSLGQQRSRAAAAGWLHAWPVPRPRDWVARVNRPETAAELEAVRRSVLRGQPFGGEPWQQETAQRLGLEYTFRRRGRPKRLTAEAKEGR